MTDEVIVDVMTVAANYAAAGHPVDEYFVVSHRMMAAALSIAKPLIAREAREMALQQAMIAVQGVINRLVNNPRGDLTILDELRNAKAAILALSNNPEVGGTPCSP